MSKRKKLSMKEQRFADEYLATGNAYKAGLAAGYSDSMAKHRCSGWVKNPSIKPHVYQYVEFHSQKESKSALERVGITKDAILAEMQKLAFANVNDYVTIDSEGLARVDLTNATKDQMAALAGIETDAIYEGEGKERKLVGHKVKVKMSDKKAALQLLGKEAGLFKDKHDVTVTDPIKVVLSDDDSSVL